MKAYTSGIAHLTHEFDEKAAVLRKAYITSLSLAKEKATKAGDLDEAIRIRDLVASIPATPPVDDAAAHGSNVLAARADLRRRLAGTIWQQNHRAPIRFNADGSVSTADSKDPWQWEAIDARHVVVRMSNGWMNCFEFDADLKKFSDTEYGRGSLADLDGARTKQ
ncbi:MAG TPA: hypothetical protein VG269_15530 [Tepidisphaeraceae bacterium]|jgi:hypothetical protein|nr:hypothetical protein [Tepidisphaeraceae bacterium]